LSTWLVLALALMAVIALLSLLPASSTTVSWCPQGVQKLGHVLFYGALAGAWLPTLGTLGAPAAAWAAWLLASSFGALMEWLQRYRPGRVGCWSDVLRNALGAGAGVILVSWLWP